MFGPGNPQTPQEKRIFWIGVCVMLAILLAIVVRAIFFMPS